MVQVGFTGLHPDMVQVGFTGLHPDMVQVGFTYVFEKGTFQKLF